MRGLSLSPHSERPRCVRTRTPTANRERAWSEFAGLNSVGLVRANEPAVFQQRQLPDQGRQGHVERPRRLGHARAAACEPLERRAPRGIAERAEHDVDALRVGALGVQATVRAVTQRGGLSIRSRE